MRTLAILILVVITAAAPAGAQGSGAGDGVRLGISFGGTSTVGVSVEWFRDGRSLDLSAGTWGFRDLSVAAVAKQYVGGRDLRPFAGIGLWLVTAFPREERAGIGLVAQAPVGVDWTVSGDHAVGAALNLNRALVVRRPDPTDDRPLNGRIVPLPGIYYRWTTP